MGSVCGDKAQERERVHFYNVCDKAFKSLQTPSQHKIWQHRSHVFVCKGCGQKFNRNNSINRHNKLVWASLTTERFFDTSSCGARTTIEEIILNLNVWGGGGEEEDCFGQLHEEGSHPLASQMEIYLVGF